MVGLVFTVQKLEATYEHSETDGHQSVGAVMGGLG